jgi:hypothetical protein
MKLSKFKHSNLFCLSVDAGENIFFKHWHQEKLTEVDLEVYLMNDHKIVVRGLTIMQTEEVLEVRHGVITQQK